ncbi:MAG: DUF3082 domain-containing protein [Thermosynechococcaceae cyanobacterium]
MPEPPIDASKNVAASVSVSPLQCVTGSMIAGILAMLLYRLTRSIAVSFAAHPLSISNQTAVSLSVAVRTLVVGMSTLATAIFAFAALGLLGLAVQLVWQRFFAAN